MCFAQLKLDLQERRLFDLLELRMAVRTAVSGYEVCYRDIFQKGVDRHRKCIIHKGEYFEK